MSDITRSYTAAVKIELDVHLYHHADGHLTAALERIAMNQAELAQALADTTTALAAAGAELTKGLGEVTTKIADLEAAISNAGNSLIYESRP